MPQRLWIYEARPSLGAVTLARLSGRLSTLGDNLPGRKVRRARGRAPLSGVVSTVLVSVVDEANPSIGILLKLSDALGVGLSALVDAPKPTAVKLTPHGTGPVLWSGDSGGRAVLVASTTPPDVVELWDWTLGPGDRHDSEPHAAGTHELLHVLQGSVVIEVAEQTITLQTGDALSFASDLPHAYGNPNPVLARFSLSVFEPAVGTSARGVPIHA